MGETESTETEAPAAADMLFLTVFERLVKSQETIAVEMKRRNDIQEKFLELAQKNSKVLNPVVKQMGKTVAKAAENLNACPTCESTGPNCMFWCHTEKFPKESP